jgi:hypothetical protein
VGLGFARAKPPALLQALFFPLVVENFISPPGRIDRGEAPRQTTRKSIAFFQFFFSNCSTDPKLSFENFTNKRICDLRIFCT